MGHDTFDVSDMIHLTYRTIAHDTCDVWDLIHSTYRTIVYDRAVTRDKT